jgi:hypothetical protein
MPKRVMSRHSDRNSILLVASLMASPRLSGFIVDRSDVNHVIAITGGDKKGPQSHCIQ